MKLAIVPSSCLIVDQLTLLSYGRLIGSLFGATHWEFNFPQNKHRINYASEEESMMMIVSKSKSGEPQVQDRVEEKKYQGWGRLHQYEKTCFAEEKEVWCRSCSIALTSGWVPNGNEGYLCSVCKLNKHALCTKCYKKVATAKETRDGQPNLLLVGCLGDGSKDETKEEEKLILLSKLQLEDSDLAVDQMPKSFVPSIEGTTITRFH